MGLNRDFPARNNGTQGVQYLRKTLTYLNTGVQTVGKIPAGSLILKPASGVHVATISNAGTNKQVDIGIIDSATNDDDYLGTDLSLGTAGFVPLDEAVGGYSVTKETTITATLDLTGTGNTQGLFEIVIAFLPPN